SPGATDLSEHGGLEVFQAQMEVLHLAEETLKHLQVASLTDCGLVASRERPEAETACLSLHGQDCAHIVGIPSPAPCSYRLCNLFLGDRHLPLLSKACERDRTYQRASSITPLRAGVRITLAFTCGRASEGEPGRQVECVVRP